MKPYKDLAYCLNCLLFSIIVGAAVYEHLAVWPSAYAAPPTSLTMFQGEYALDAQAFWIPIHPVTLLSFAISAALFWRTPRRKFVLIPLVGYVAVLIITFIYFVPELLSIVATEYSSVASEDLTRRAATWEALSLARLASLIVMAFVLYLGLAKAPKTAPS